MKSFHGKANTLSCKQIHSGACLGLLLNFGEMTKLSVFYSHYLLQDRLNLSLKNKSILILYSSMSITMRKIEKIEFTSLYLP